MSEQNSDIFAELFSKEDESVETGAPTPIKVLEETGFLEDPLGEVLLKVYTEGMMSLKEVANEVDLTKSQAKRHLGELRLQGYLGVEFEAGQKFYYVKSRWETEEFPSGPVIPLVYQYNLLSDDQRLSTIKEAIDEHIETGDVVADLGAGVGVLSYLASDKAKKVYAVEMDREVFEEGSRIMENEGLDNVEYIRDDARAVDLPEKVDVILCEMLDTALVAELQVPVMNYAIEEPLTKIQQSYHALQKRPEH
ncbi:methyltransferase domain-containing protein [Halonotius sp. GCM10025705]|uniref:methyltransferase domain-containing protein n=1 Tax=Halonotius sp. GCM10025705 TaxID=3252678 RepID=UPI0036208EB8